MTNTPETRTANMVHFPSKDASDPNALDEYLDTLRTDVAAIAQWTEHPDNPKATTSGTSVLWTGIPSGTKEILVSFVGVSTNGTSPFLIRIGDAGGIEATGYVTRCRGTSTGTSATTGMIVTTSNHAAASVLYGNARLSLITGGAWTYASNCVGSSRLFIGGGIKTLSAFPLTQLSLTTVGGTNTFDAGSVFVRYL
jgi:hypothetical protein